MWDCFAGIPLWFTTVGFSPGCKQHSRLNRIFWRPRNSCPGLVLVCNTIQNHWETTMKNNTFEDPGVKPCQDHRENKHKSNTNEPCERWQQPASPVFFPDLVPWFMCWRVPWFMVRRVHLFFVCSDVSVLVFYQFMFWLLSHCVPWHRAWAPSNICRKWRRPDWVRDAVKTNCVCAS